MTYASQLDAERAAEEFAEMLLPFSVETRVALIAHILETLEDRLVTTGPVRAGAESTRNGLGGVQRTAAGVRDCINGWFRGKAWKA